MSRRHRRLRLGDLAYARDLLIQGFSLAEVAEALGVLTNELAVALWNSLGEAA